MSGNRNVNQQVKNKINQSQELELEDANGLDLRRFPAEMWCYIGSYLDRESAINFTKSCRAIHSYFQPILNRPTVERLVQLVADGDKDEVQKILDKNPHLVLQAAKSITPGGTKLTKVTPYKCAIVCGDPELALIIGKYFEKFEDGVGEREAQFKPYEKGIENLFNVRPYDFSNLIKIIKQSSAEDIDAERNNILTFMGADVKSNSAGPFLNIALSLDYNRSHKSMLRTELETFRKAFAPCELESPEEQIEYLGYIYKSWLEAIRVLLNEWNALRDESAEDLTNYSQLPKYNKNLLVWNQVIGFIERRVPAVERFICAQGYHDLFNGVQLERSLVNKDDRRSLKKEDWRSFPITRLEDDSHSGLGFDFAESIFGRNGFYYFKQSALIMNVIRKLFQVKALGYEKLKQQVKPDPALDEVKPDQPRSRCMIV